MNKYGKNLSLALLVPRVGLAYDIHIAAAADDVALRADALDCSSYFHGYVYRRLMMRARPP